MTRFLVVPQWQGSSSSRAMQLIDGATAIAGDLPRASCTTVEVPMEAGEALDSGIRRLSALQQTARAQREASAGIDDVVLTVGGDAGVATTAALVAAGMPDAADAGTVVLWFSAHAAMHDTASSPTGAFDTMAARTLIDAALLRATQDLSAPASALAPERLVLAGVRVIDPAEAETIERMGVGLVSADELSPEAVATALTERGATAVFVHVDLDVLDPAAIAGVSDAEPFGPDVVALTAAIAAARAVAPLRGAALTEFSPSSPAAAVDDLGAILRIVGALA